MSASLHARTAVLNWSGARGLEGTRTPQTRARSAHHTPLVHRSAGRCASQPCAGTCCAEADAPPNVLQVLLLLLCADVGQVQAFGDALARQFSACVARAWS
jgi:hypothetical protein